MSKCKYAKKYKGIFEPSCGCSKCLSIWNNKQYESWQDKLFYRLIEYYTYPEEVREEAKQTAIKWL